MKYLVVDLDFKYSRKEIIENGFYYESFKELFNMLVESGVGEILPEIIFIYTDINLKERKTIVFPLKEYYLWLKYVVLESSREIDLSKEKNEILKALDEKYLD